ncbi:MAG: ABC transporter ATP-binding protein [Deltaproteobacteria bacterium]|nr:ABC transporter ATP-binding protein [Deltaproteobacteria bacterium]
MDGRGAGRRAERHPRAPAGALARGARALGALGRHAGDLRRARGGSAHRPAQAPGRRRGARHEPRGRCRADVRRRRRVAGRRHQGGQRRRGRRARPRRGVAPAARPVGTHLRSEERAHGLRPVVGGPQAALERAVAAGGQRHPLVRRGPCPQVPRSEPRVPAVARRRRRAGGRLRAPGRSVRLLAGAQARAAALGAARDAAPGARVVHAAGRPRQARQGLPRARAPPRGGRGRRRVDARDDHHAARLLRGRSRGRRCRRHAPDRHGPRRRAVDGRRSDRARSRIDRGPRGARAPLADDRGAGGGRARGARRHRARGQRAAPHADQQDAVDARARGAPPGHRARLAGALALLRQRPARGHGRRARRHRRRSSHPSARVARRRRRRGRRAERSIGRRDRRHRGPGDRLAGRVVGQPAALRAADRHRHRAHLRRRGVGVEGRARGDAPARGRPRRRQGQGRDRARRAEGQGAGAVIRVRHLTHRYGDREVLRDVSFHVRKGEIFGFIGPNGAGKTTTIRIMATLMEPTSGRVEIDEVDVEVDPEAVRRRIGYMADNPGVYERVTVAEYLDFFAAAYRVPASERASTVAAVVELTDLGVLRDRLVAELSKGMKQRIQLARTLLHDPKVLILDEPASDLDPRARIEMRDLLMELRRMGKTIFLSSHILAELADMCTSVGILEKGRLVASGPVDAIARAIDRGAEGDARPRRRARLRVLGSALMVTDVLSPRGVEVEPIGDAANGNCVIAYEGDETALSELVRALVSSGVPLVGIEPERNELERIFLEVTRGEVQ